MKKKKKKCCGQIPPDRYTCPEPREFIRYTGRKSQSGENKLRGSQPTLDLDVQILENLIRNAAASQIAYFPGIQHALRPNMPKPGLSFQVPITRISHFPACNGPSSYMRIYPLLCISPSFAMGHAVNMM